jgi:multisubunit Na+/H+ antiporter MnhF subunit
MKKLKKQFIVLFLNIIAIIIYIVVYLYKKLNMPTNIIIFSVFSLTSILFSFLFSRNNTRDIYLKVALLLLFIAIIWPLRYIILF